MRHNKKKSEVLGMKQAVKMENESKNICSDTGAITGFASLQLSTACTVRQGLMFLLRQNILRSVVLHLPR